LVSEPTAVEARDLVQTLRHLSWRETGIPVTLPFTLEAASDSVLAWYLRDFGAAHIVRDLGALDMENVGEEMARVLVTPRRDLRDLVATDAEIEYVGQDFALRRSWDPLEVGCTWEWPLRCGDAVGWLLFRHTPSPPEIDRWAVLWQRSDLADTVIPSDRKERSD